MSEGLISLVYGAIGGGVVALLLRFLEVYWIDFRLGDRIQARRKLRYYAKPLWLDCRELRFRLQHVLGKFRGEIPDKNLKPLGLTPREHAKSLEWYTKEGYYVTSTAYLLASVACWIRLFQRDVVFLQFGKSSSTAEFFQLIEGLKQTISKRPSLLWYLYFNGIGEQLLTEDQQRPMTTAEFAIRLHTDDIFSKYFDQLFQFLRQMSTEDYIPIIEAVNDKLRAIQEFLQKTGAVPPILGA